MSVMRNRPKGARIASFGLGLCVFAVFPNEIGYQDIASLLVRQPGVTERWQKRMFASSFGSIQVATFSFGRPIGTWTPQVANSRLASLDGRFGLSGAMTRNRLAQPPQPYQASDFPAVDRTLKGDRLAIFKPEPASPDDAAPSATDDSNAPNVAGAKIAAKPTAHEPTETSPLDPELAEALQSEPLTPYDVAHALESDPLHAAGPADAAGAPPRDPFTFKTASLFFGTGSLGGPDESLEQWQPGEEPIIVTPHGADPDMKSPLLSATAVAPDVPGETIAGKGEVNIDRHARTPAERLGLSDPKLRARHEKCLAEAVYFESRGEKVRGQIAVAQVVLNRAFSGFYPTNVCGVVYQNKHRRLACQFTFACDRVADIVREPEMWDRARRIAAAMLDGKLWLPEVDKSTHYHAYWVRPSWVHEMKKMYKTGVHTFYRPRKWGDGSDAPSWGDAAQTAAISAQLSEAARSSAEISAKN
ncbi:Cell wall hydrolase, SleB [Rhodopseudomonas palustris HaA2]|uniref:Cell wall hydrolase, SleB n=1 Tax=Rhodopseudomonas palustris (strain HaA2) TaxID=316058 RepID=Q2J146_RHOP2|nr:cell wall hydrolase [Rhodopseudomonas palustris]ABD05814.1 Cell wall hydrolase, SleB [Rhodopseudomonas palustris HaA2]